MSKVLVSDTSLSAIATAIRAKNGESTLYKPAEMAAAIRAIPTGGSAVLEPLSVTENGTYTPGEGVDGFSSVEVDVSSGSASRLPAEYQEVEYIRFSGNAWYLDNVPMLRYQFSRFVASFDSTSGTRIVVGLHDTNSNNSNSGQNGSSLYYSGSSSKYLPYDSVTFTANVFYDVTVRNGNGSYWYNMVLIGTNLSGSSPGSSYMVGKIKEVEILDHITRDGVNGTLPQYHYIPCYRKSDNEIGFYERIRGNFLTKNGTGTVEAGPNV